MNEITQQIQTDTAGEIAETLQFMLEECALDQAPDRQTVQQWHAILQQRGGKFQRLAQMCQTWLDETA